MGETGPLCELCDNVLDYTLDVFIFVNKKANRKRAARFEAVNWMHARRIYSNYLPLSALGKV